MSETYSYDNEHDFVHKLKELAKSGVARDDITFSSPFPVHHAFEVFDELPERATSPLKFFTLLGGITGLLAGFGLTIYSVLMWPMITGGKPIISIPAYIVIAYEMTILLGGIFSFLGFLLLAKVPSIKYIFWPVETGNKFVIEVNDEEEDTGDEL